MSAIIIQFPQSRPANAAVACMAFKERLSGKPGGNAFLSG